MGMMKDALESMDATPVTVVSGWEKIDERHYRTTPENREEALRLLREHDNEKRDCKSCQQGGMMPSHSRVYPYDDGTGLRLVSRRCESNSRWYNPVKKVWEGYMHCTCGSCF